MTSASHVMINTKTYIFTLMSNLCGINASMTYDYYLPLEQMDYRYEPFIRALGIGEYTNVSIIQKGKHVKKCLPQ
jgi:hypothetical protein